MKSGNYSWMKGMECKKSKGAATASKATEKLLMNIAVKGKTKKAFEGF